MCVIGFRSPSTQLENMGLAELAQKIRPGFLMGVHTHDDYLDVYWEVIRAVKMRFDEEGISIPFPQRDVHFYPQRPQES